MKTIKYVSSHTNEVIELELEITKYRNGQNAISLYFEGEPYMTASVAHDINIQNDEVIIKNYSENEGILEALIEAEIIDPEVTPFRVNFVVLFVAKLK